MKTKATKPKGKTAKQSAARVLKGLDTLGKMMTEDRIVNRTRTDAQCARESAIMKRIITLENGLRALASVQPDSAQLRYREAEACLEYHQARHAELLDAHKRKMWNVAVDHAVSNMRKIEEDYDFATGWAGLDGSG